MLADHVAQGRECTVGCIEVDQKEATAFGVMAIDAKRLILDFVEKPADPPTIPGKPGRSLASMGIYIFNARFLYRELERDMLDFAFDVRPQSRLACQLRVSPALEGLVVQAPARQY